MRLEPSPPAGSKAWRSGLLPLSALLYVLAFPGLGPGFGFLAFVAFVPALAWLSGATVPKAALAGLAFGAASYAGISHWVANYHPAALGVTAFLGALWFTPLFAALSLALRLPRGRAAVVVALLWAAADSARGAGFLAFPYGTLPYALYEYGFALRIASVGGAETVGALIILANYGLFCAAERLAAGRAAAARAANGEPPSGFRLARAAWPGIAALAFALLTVAMGRPAAPEPTAARAEGFRVALVQAGVRERQYVADDYRAMAERLIELSGEALAGDPDLVVWHETSVIPPIEWHLRRRIDRPITEILLGLQAFLDAYPVPLLLGNGWADPEDPSRRTQGNAAILYEGGRPRDRYLKMALVPFSEYFPYERRLPGVARWLEDRFGYFWQPGEERRIFELGGRRFAAPICFEDSFGSHLALFDEPDFFIVLTDDSWAKSEGMQRQHLAMTTFRAAETATTFLRAANTGATAAVGPNGRVISILPAFEPGVLHVELGPAEAKRTAYERWGRFLGPAYGYLGLALAIALATLRLASLRSRDD